MEIDQFLGKQYLMVSEENFEAYLTYIGLGYLQRKLAVNVRPKQCLTKNEDGSYTFSVKASFFHWDMNFIPGVEFDGDKPDGTKIKTLITFEGNVMIHKQTDTNGIISTHVIEFSAEQTKTTTTATGSDIVARRVYKLVK